MFLEIHIILIIPRSEVAMIGGKTLPNLAEVLRKYPGYHSFGRWTYSSDKEQYECYVEFMDCFAGKYKNYFAENGICYRPNTFGCEKMCKRFRGGYPDITDPLTAVLYERYELLKIAKSP